MEDKCIHNWLQKVKAEAEELGIYYLIAAIDKDNTELINFECNIQSDFSVLEKELSNVSHKPRRTLTFYDLYKYIKTAERDQFGFHYLPDKRYALHIYEGKNQVNICRDNGTFYESVLNILFDEYNGDVTFIEVYNGIAFYDNPIIVNISYDPGYANISDIDKLTSIKNICLHEFEFSRLNYDEIIEVISDAIQKEFIHHSNNA